MLKKILTNKITFAAATAMAFTVSPLLHSSAYGDSVDISTGIGAWQVAFVAAATQDGNGNYTQPNYSFSGPVTTLDAVDQYGLHSVSTLGNAGTSPNGVWNKALGSSSWVGPHSWSGGTGQGQGSSVGVYVYQLDLGSLIAGHTYTITGEITPTAEAYSDNDFIGGAYLTNSTMAAPTLYNLIPATTPTGSGENIDDFNVVFTASAISGTAGNDNYLDFVVNNGTSSPTSNVNNPTGFDLSADLVTTPLPKPALAGFGLLTGLGLIGRRRASQIA